MKNELRWFAGVAMGIAVTAALSRRSAEKRRYSFRGRSVVITGGSRGLGLVLARQFAAEGARVSLLARNTEELLRAENQIASFGASVLGIGCDVREQQQVDRAIERVMEAHGRLDVLVNNAGVIQVGPLEHMTLEDFEDAMAVHFYGPLHAIMAALPHMRRRGSGRIVNISSIGGKIAVPHLLPYCASKFALVGLSQGLALELRRENILVTTVCPGLMRTGSPRNALFKGQHRKEYAWFAIGDSLPLLSMSAESAARRILEALRRGSSRLVLGAHMRAAVALNELFPGLTDTLLSATNRVLPSADPKQLNRSYAGHESESVWAPSWLTRLTQQAAIGNNELG